MQLQGAGFADVKPLHVTGGMSFELDEPRCKPQVQKTGTIYMPFCAGKPLPVIYTPHECMWIRHRLFMAADYLLASRPQGCAT